MSKQLKFSFPSPSQFRHVGSILSTKEKVILYLALFILIGSLIAWAIYYYVSSTEKQPHFGGEYTEGMIGQPLYVNPILSQSNEVDGALCKLVFSSLMAYDKNGNLINDVAERYEISQDGKEYTFYLKQNVLWHDKTQLTAKDIAFTIKLIQDKAFKSTLRGDWQNVNVEAIDDYTIKFSIPEPYSPFLNKTNFGILPKHVFDGVSAESFLVSEFNLKPVGSGPFVFSHYEKDEEDNIISYQLLTNKEYYNGRSYLDKFIVNFYTDEFEMVDAYNKKEINGFGVLSYETTGQFEGKKDTNIYSMRTPRYFGVFLNKTRSLPLAKSEVRKALQHATNRDEIIQQVFYSYATSVYSPMLKNFGEFDSTKGPEQFSYDPQRAEQLLDEAGWNKGDDGIRSKDGEKLEFSLITTQWPDLVRTADLLKSQWESIGVILNVSNLEVSDIQQNFIKPREYQSILFGQEYFGNDPDPFYFWHSNGKKDPGRNIAVYDNEEVDTLLDEARKTNNLDERREKYRKFEDNIENDSPAIFLYSPDYIYITNSKIKGIETSAIINPAHRFSNVEKWYIKTIRNKKQ
jgi:peptide/nickel transport system substrate-binding protein